MKKFTMLIVSLCVLSATFTATLIQAAGLHYPGEVRITESGTRQIMLAEMSVRYNDSASSSWVQAWGAPPYWVRFDGDDGSNEFSCYVKSSHQYYKDAIDIQNALSSGGQLFVAKQKNSTNCESFSLSNYSYYLD